MTHPRKPPATRPNHPQTKPDPTAAPAYGAIDLGTNNCRMLVARPVGDDFRVIDSFSRIVRLGEGVAAEGRLNEDAISRTISALKICASKLRGAGALRVRSVTTEACRRADNTPDFIARVLKETNIALEAISPQEEADLTLAGCSPLLDRSHPHALVFDIGGGSTEVVWIDATAEHGPQTLDVISLPHGVVTLSEDFAGRTEADEEYETIVDLIDRALADFDARNGISKAVQDKRVQMLGTSGTVTTLGAMHLNLKRYDRSRVDGLTLGFDAIGQVIGDLSTMDHDARLRHACIGPRRSDLIMAGCAVLDAVCRRWPIGSLIVADRGIREGILTRLMTADGHALCRQGCLQGDRP